MTNQSYARTAAGMFDTINRRLTSVERRLPPVPYVPPEGTTAQRDAHFRVPTTDAERVVLANRRVQWFNTESGWAESYYAVTGLPGLTARGLVTGTASGWYPIGRGPRLAYGPNHQDVAAGGGLYVGEWHGYTFVNGAGWFTYDNATGVFTIAHAGRYLIRASFTIQPGSGMADIYLWVGAGYKNSGHTLGTYISVWQDAIFDTPIPAGGTTKVTLVSASGVVFPTSASSGFPGHRGEYIIEYLGPNLVSN